MLKWILDTNIYGELVEEEHNEKLVAKLEKEKINGNIVIHNFKVIRNELREAKAMNVLEIYDKLTANTIHLSDKKVEEIAEAYFKKYKENGGIQEKTQNFMNDMRIIAFASLKGTDVICSNDKKAFHNNLAKRTYVEINGKLLLRPPYFINLEELRKAFS
tara:strand:- start:459 stop:938 length:480 start_codon:yes stop_codon:yes gene_type:complete